MSVRRGRTPNKSGLDELVSHKAQISEIDKPSKTPVTKTRSKSINKQRQTTKSSSTIMAVNVGMDESTQQPIVFNIPITTDAHDEDSTVLYIFNIVLTYVSISKLMQYILYLAKSFASLSPWMFTFEMTDELNLTFYVAEEELGVSDSNEDSLYDQLRIQPTAFGYYLRASLWAGYGTMLFNTWSLFSLPRLSLFDEVPAGTSASSLESQQEQLNQYIAVLIHIYLLTQLILNLLLLTPRIVIHLQCWSCTNLQVYSLDDSLDALRCMLRSDVWIAGRLLSRVQDGITVLSLLVFQLILHVLKVTDSNVVIYDTLVSLSATSIFMVVLRFTVATLYSISCHDPAVVEEARQRGLTPDDIDFMKTYEFKERSVNSNAEPSSNTKRTRSARAKSANTNTECSICLLSYEKGDKLIVLSCNKNHIFHDACIRNWLEKQNACPLCQKLV